MSAMHLTFIIVVSLLQTCSRSSHATLACDCRQTACAPTPSEHDCLRNAGIFVPKDVALCVCCDRCLYPKGHAYNGLIPRLLRDLTVERTANKILNLFDLWYDTRDSKKAESFLRPKRSPYDDSADPPLNDYHNPLDGKPNADYHDDREAIESRRRNMIMKNADNQRRRSKYWHNNRAGQYYGQRGAQIPDAEVERMAKPKPFYDSPIDLIDYNGPLKPMLSDLPDYVQDDYVTIDERRNAQRPPDGRTGSANRTKRLLITIRVVKKMPLSYPEKRPQHIKVTVGFVWNAKLKRWQCLDNSKVRPNADQMKMFKEAGCFKPGDGDIVRIIDETIKSADIEQTSTNRTVERVYSYDTVVPHTTTTTEVTELPDDAPSICPDKRTSRVWTVAPTTQPESEEIGGRVRPKSTTCVTKIADTPVKTTQCRSTTTGPLSTECRTTTPKTPECKSSTSKTTECRSTTPPTTECRTTESEEIAGRVRKKTTECRSTTPRTTECRTTEPEEPQTEVVSDMTTQCRSTTNRGKTIECRSTTEYITCVTTESEDQQPDVVSVDADMTTQCRTTTECRTTSGESEEPQADVVSVDSEMSTQCRTTTEADEIGGRVRKRTTECRSTTIECRTTTERCRTTTEDKEFQTPTEDANGEPQTTTQPPITLTTDDTNDNTDIVSVGADITVQCSSTTTESDASTDVNEADVVRESGEEDEIGGRVRKRTTECRSTTAKCRSTTAKCRSTTAKCRSTTKKCKSTTTNCRSTTSECRSSTRRRKSKTKSCKTTTTCRPLTTECRSTSTESDEQADIVSIGTEMAEEYRTTRRLYPILGCQQVHDAYQMCKRKKHKDCDELRVASSQCGYPEDPKAVCEVIREAYYRCANLKIMSNTDSVDMCEELRTAHLRCEVNRRPQRRISVCHVVGEAYNQCVKDTTEKSPEHVKMCDDLLSAKERCRFVLECPAIRQAYRDCRVYDELNTADCTEIVEAFRQCGSIIQPITCEHIENAWRSECVDSKSDFLEQCQELYEARQFCGYKAKIRVCDVIQNAYEYCLKVTKGASPEACDNLKIAALDCVANDNGYASANLKDRDSKYRVMVLCDNVREAYLKCQPNSTKYDPKEMDKEKCTDLERAIQSCNSRAKKSRKMVDNDDDMKLMATDEDDEEGEEKGEEGNDYLEEEDVDDVSGKRRLEQRMNGKNSRNKEKEKDDEKGGSDESGEASRKKESNKKGKRKS